MTGIASSGKLHLGHAEVVEVFSIFKKLGAKNYFGIADIDGYVSRNDSKVPSLKKAKEFAIENLSHVLALGLSEKDVFVQSKMGSRYYEFAFEISKKITTNTFEAIYGHLDLGKVSANLLQYADILHAQLPEYEGKMPSITVVSPDQDPHIRATREIVKRLQYDFEVPSGLIFLPLPSLKGPDIKMSSSLPETAIYLDDDPKVAAKKIMSAFTGQQATAELQKKLGGNPDVCSVCQYYRFLFEKNDKKVQQIFEKERSGELLAGEHKQDLAEHVVAFLEKHQEKLEKTKEIAKQLVLG
jgi:tryptophanyl-tRNA synthetase